MNQNNFTLSIQKIKAQFLQHNFYPQLKNLHPQKSLFFLAHITLCCKYTISFFIISQPCKCLKP